jgi:hypothetical protein
MNITRTIVTALLTTAAAGLLLTGCGSPVAGTATTAPARVTVTAAPSTVTQAPVTITQPPTTVAPPLPTTTAAPRTAAPTGTIPLDSVVPRHAAHGTPADNAMDKVYADEKSLVDMYLGVGNYIDDTEAGQLNGALSIVSTDLDDLLVQLNTNSFSNAQLTAITDTCNAGTTLQTDMAVNSAPDSTVQADWAVFDAGYQAYVAATN